MEHFPGNLSVFIWWHHFEVQICFQGTGSSEATKEPNCYIGYEGLLFSFINSIHSISLFSGLRLHSSLPKTFSSATMEDNGQPCSDSFFLLQHGQYTHKYTLLILCLFPLILTHSDPCSNPGGRNLFWMFLIQLECNKLLIRPEKTSFLEKNETSVDRQYWIFYSDAQILGQWR